MNRLVLAIALAWLMGAGIAVAQTPAPAPAAPPPAAAQPAPAAATAATAITAEDLKAISGPKPEDKAKGDPAGTITGTVNDIPVSDPKKGLALDDLVNTVGQNVIASNFIWTLVTGFLVMFMQAGFAIVETGLARAKNANHTMMMNFMVYGVGMAAYWIIGFAIQMGGVAPNTNLGGLAPLNHEVAISLFGKNWGLFGTQGMFLGGATYDVGVMVMFLFQMVFMDTALTIVTGTAAERWKYSAFVLSSLFMGAFIYPIFANWAWGGGWLATLGASYGLGHGYCDFAGSGVVHSVGGVTALAMAIIIGPRIGKFTRQGKPNAIPGHDIVLVLLGCFILAFGWFGFNPGSTLGAATSGNLRISSVAVNTMLAGMAGSFSGMYYMWIRYGKPDASMTGNAFLAGLVAITAPSGFVNPMASVIIGLVAGVLVCLSCEFIERTAKLDDVVGAISVHGTNGIWGVISVGLFADGTSNYAGAWNGVPGSVTGLFYGDAGQLVAQLIGVATLLGFVFSFSFVLNAILEAVWGHRVTPEVELQGLDIPEMGALGYPEFVLRKDALAESGAA
ncbi:MAG TPA: ammonium transporter [Vicinamibacterales bacterium]|nr:ammonium transporter [Vicinamibacterales bacterium]